MKAGNVKYLVFGPDGKLLEDNEIVAKIDAGDGSKIDVKVTFDFTLGIEYGNIPVELAGSVDNFYMPRLSCRAKSGHFVCNDYYFYDVKLDGKQHAAIIYHDGLEPNAFYLFYEWYRWYLPARVPFCCCKAKFYRIWLPYVNSVLRTMCEKFPEAGQYHKDDEINDHYSIGPKELNVMPEELQDKRDSK